MASTKTLNSIEIDLWEHGYNQWNQDVTEEPRFGNDTEPCCRKIDFAVAFGVQWFSRQLSAFRCMGEAPTRIRVVAFEGCSFQIRVLIPDTAAHSTYHYSRLQWWKCMFGIKLLEKEHCNKARCNAIQQMYHGQRRRRCLETSLQENVPPVQFRFCLP